MLTDDAEAIAACAVGATMRRIRKVTITPVEYRSPSSPDDRDGPTFMPESAPVAGLR